MKVNEIPIVIPVFGREDVFRTVPFLMGLAEASRIRLFVIDNGNGPELSGRLKGLAGPRCEVVSFPENRGGSAAYIAGVEAAMERFPDAPYIWLLDDDATPDERTLPALVGTMDALIASGKRVASVGSAVLDAKNPGVVAECGAGFSPILMHAFPRLAGKRLADVPDKTIAVDYAAACSLLVNVAAVRECGFWKDVFIHFDDIEWGLRMKRFGWENFATTSSTVTHPPFDPEKAGAWICYFDSRNQYWLAFECYGPLHVASVRMKDALKNLRARLTGRHRERVPFRILAWKDFLSGVRRSRSEAVAAVSAEGTSV